GAPVSVRRPGEQRDQWRAQITPPFREVAVKPLGPGGDPGGRQPLDPRRGHETEEIADVFVAWFENPIGPLRTEELGPERVGAERKKDRGRQPQCGHDVSSGLPDGSAISTVHGSQESKSD